MRGDENSYKQKGIFDLRFAQRYILRTFRFFSYRNGADTRDSLKATGHECGGVHCGGVHTPTTGNIGATV